MTYRYIYGHKVYGNNIDPETRCLHYSTVLDRIALKFKCCRTYYSCYKCHERIADHAPEVFQKEDKDCKVILCGSCGFEMTLLEYLECNSKCPKCYVSFNPGCKKHLFHYFGFFR